MPELPSLPRWQRRHRFRLGLRGLMLLILVMGVWMGYIVRRARVQREVVAAVRQLGGSVQYDDQRRLGKDLQIRQIRAHRWLVDRLGVDYFSSATIVRFGPSRGDEIAAQLGRLESLDSLTCHDAGLTDAGLASLEGLDLRMLTFSGCRVTDAGLRAVRGMKNLEVLNLSETDVGDAGMVHLVGLAKLYSLNLSRTRLSDAGVESIEKLRGLETLNLTGTAVGEVSVARLKTMVGLFYLLLEPNRFGQQAIEELRAALPHAGVNPFPTRTFSSPPNP